MAIDLEEFAEQPKRAVMDGNQVEVHPLKEVREIQNQNKTDEVLKTGLGIRMFKSRTQGGMGSTF